MDFGEALRQMRMGSAVRRAGWQGSSVTLQTPDEHSKMTLPYFFLTTSEGQRVPWFPPFSDLLADDWLLIGVSKDEPVNVWVAERLSVEGVYAAASSVVGMVGSTSAPEQAKQFTTEAACLAWAESLGGETYRAVVRSVRAGSVSA